MGALGGFILLSNMYSILGGMLYMRVALDSVRHVNLAVEVVEF